VPVRSSDATFWLLCLAMGLVTVTLSALATLVPLYAVRLGGGATLVGVLVALPNVLPVALALPAGRLVDAGGPRRWLRVGTGGMVLAPLAVTALAGLAAMAAAQLLLGAFHLFATLASQSFVARLGNDRSHERNFAWYSTILSVGRMLGPVLAGVTVDAAGFRVAFAAVTGVAVLAAGLTTLMRVRPATTVAPDSGAPPGPEPSAEPAAQAPSAAPGSDQRAGGVREAARNVGVQLAILASSGVFVAIAVRQAFLPVYLQALEYPATVIGALLSSGALAAVLVRPIMPVVTRALRGPARTLVIAMTLVAVAVGALGLASTLPPLVLLTVLAGLGTGVAMPLSIVTVASHVTGRGLGVALGLRLSVNRSAQLLAPVAVGALITVSGFAVAFAVAGAALLLAAGVAATRVGSFERSRAASVR
jgi:MFS family permease